MCLRQKKSFAGTGKVVLRGGAKKLEVDLPIRQVGFRENLDFDLSNLKKQKR